MSTLITKKKYQKRNVNDNFEFERKIYFVLKFWQLFLQRQLILSDPTGPSPNLNSIECFQSIRISLILLWSGQCHSIHIRKAVCMCLFFNCLFDIALILHIQKSLSENTLYIILYTRMILYKTQWDCFVRVHCFYD